MLTPLTFYKDLSTGIEIVCFDNSSIAYEEHTHTSHFVLALLKKVKLKSLSIQKSIFANRINILSLLLIQHTA